MGTGTALEERLLLVVEFLMPDYMFTLFHPDCNKSFYVSVFVSYILVDCYSFICLLLKLPASCMEIATWRHQKFERREKTPHYFYMSDNYLDHLPNRKCLYDFSYDA